jgi:hypothetical protein
VGDTGPAPDTGGSCPGNQPDRRRTVKQTVLKRVKSSNISAVGWEPFLVIKFKSGGTYIYKGVPEKMYKKFLKAKSKGKFFFKNVKGKFEFEKLQIQKGEK